MQRYKEREQDYSRVATSNRKLWIPSELPPAPVAQVDKIGRIRCSEHGLVLSMSMRSELSHGVYSIPASTLRCLKGAVVCVVRERGRRNYSTV